MKRLLLCLLLAASLVGCDVLGDDSSPTLDGPYQIKTLAQGSQFTFDVTLSESDDSLTGPGTLTIGDQDSEAASIFDLDVSGSHNHPDVHVEMKLTDLNQQVNFDGTTKDGASRVEGRLTFPEGNQQDVVMRSQ